jgi:nitric oxide reductase NorD protein
VIRRSRRVELAAVRRRLELLLKATHGRDFTIVADRSPPIRWWERFFSDVRSPTRSPEPVLRVDAQHIVLPVRLHQSGRTPSAGDRFRLLAMAAAERLVRGSLSAHARLDTALERELFWVREGVLMDAAIAQRSPALAQALVHARARMRAARPGPKSLTARERALEQLVQDALRTEPQVIPPVFDAGASPEDSLEWARAGAVALASLPRGFGGTAPVAHWGICPHEPIARPDSNPMMWTSSMMMGAVESFARGDDGVTDEPTEDSRGKSPSEATADSGRQDAATAGIGDAYDSNRRYPRRHGTPHRYPEWDDDRHRYVSDAVTVWTEAAPSAEPGVAPVTESAVVSRRLRSQFEQLRVQRQTSRRQFSGDALDLAALTDALVDRRMGHSADERVYERTQANRRALAIGVLVDVSGSTGNQLEDGARIIDLERQALLMAHDALEAVGDPYAMFAFAGLGAHDVQVLSVKGFDERGSVARARIHALQPDQNTRLGAAVRHVSRVLSAQPASSQLLLVITDGRPSDMNYHEEYAVADTHRAILDARNQGTTVFGLAIDFEDHEYLVPIFGASGYVYVRDPHSLGRQLVHSIASMLRS